MGLSCCCDELSGYKIIKKNIGECSNGKIHKVFKDKKYYAMKVMKYEAEEEKEEMQIKRIENEINIFKCFDHHNIVEYIDSFNINDKIYIIMELCESDLNKFMNNKRKKNELIDEKVICIILKDISYGLKEVHSKNIIHRDLKPANILISTDKKFKIADFGISKYNDQPLTNDLGTNRYAAPELLDNKPYDEKADLWSLGCIIQDLCSSEFPSIISLYNVESKINQKYNEKLQELINELKVLEPEKRIDLNKVVTKINNLELNCKSQNENLDQLSQEILIRKKENEIKLDIEIGKDDINKDIYFFDGENHENLKELNEKNTELYIYNRKENKISETFQKKYIFRMKGNYKILLKLKEELSDSSYMFYKCLKLKNIDLTFFDTTNIINMSNMFAYSNIKSIDLSSIKTYKVKNMKYMFAFCENLEQLDLSSFDTSNVEDMSFMFKSCNNIKDINLSSFKTQKVTNMSNMFEDCQSIKEINLSTFILSKGIKKDYMFTNCKSLKKIQGYDSLIRNATYEQTQTMFQGCEELVLDNERKNIESNRYKKEILNGK